MLLRANQTSAWLAAVLLVTASAAWAGKKTYTEDEFINNFSGKPKKQVIDKLGEPFKKQLSVKPSNAGNMIAGMGKKEDNSKPVKVEMWYYKDVVRYDAKRTYKETEVTFVNDRVMNIGFFNNR